MKSSLIHACLAVALFGCGGYLTRSDPVARDLGDWPAATIDIGSGGHGHKVQLGDPHMSFIAPPCAWEVTYDPVRNLPVSVSMTDGRIVRLKRIGGGIDVAAVAAAVKKEIGVCASVSAIETRGLSEGRRLATFTATDWRDECKKYPPDKEGGFSRVVVIRTPAASYLSLIYYWGDNLKKLPDDPEVESLFNSMY